MWSFDFISFYCLNNLPLLSWFLARIQLGLSKKTIPCWTVNTVFQGSNHLLNPKSSNSISILQHASETSQLIQERLKWGWNQITHKHNLVNLTWPPYIIIQLFISIFFLSLGSTAYLHSLFNIPMLKLACFTSYFQKITISFLPTLHFSQHISVLRF